MDPGGCNPRGNRVKAAPRGTRQLHLRFLSHHHAGQSPKPLITSLLKRCKSHSSHRSSPNYLAQLQRLTANFSSSNRVLATTSLETELIHVQDMSAIDRDRPRLTIARRARRRTRLAPRYSEGIDTYCPHSTIARRAGRRMLLVPLYGKTINTYLPMELMREIFLYCIESNPMKSGQLASVCRYWKSVMTTVKTINTCLPMELMREIFLYCIESNQIKSGQLASVCRYWRSVITTLPSLWSTLRVGTWTETEQVVTWLQRAYPRKVIIDPKRDTQSPSEAPMFAALQSSLSSTGQWNELTISSFPPENLVSQLGVQVASPMKVLKVLYVEAGCMNSPSFAHLLNLVPTEAPLCEMRLHPPFVTTHFLQPHWFPVLRNLIVLIVNGRDMNEPFELLPTFTQLQTFEADRLCLPFHELNANLPLIRTLRKLQLRACSVQWMAGRQFPCLEECAILLPHHWEQIQWHQVQLPSCKKLTYHGYPMTTAQYFDVPEMRAMDLRSHDCDERRVYQHLRHLCRVNGRISNLTTLHLTFQCSEQVLTKVLKYLIPLQELTLSITHPSPAFQTFLESLAAKPSTNEWPEWDSWMDYHGAWEKWCSSQTWHANVLPHLKFLSIHCPKGFSQSERLDNFLFLSAIRWTRSYLTPPLEHLKVWEGRGSMTDDIAVDYTCTSTDDLDKDPEISRKEHDATIVMTLATRHLEIAFPDTRLLALYSTALFRRLRHLVLTLESNHEILVLPYLEQIERLQISNGRTPEYSLNVDLPLTHTLQSLNLNCSTSSWMLGRTFKALREFTVGYPPNETENHSRHEGLQVDLPACTTLWLLQCSMDYFCFLSCSNIQILRWWGQSRQTTFDLAAFTSLHDFLFNLSFLKNLDILVPDGLGIDSLFDFVFCWALEHRVWQDIRSVEVEIRFNYSFLEASDFIDQTVGRQLHYERWWKSFTVTQTDLKNALITASM